MCISSHCLFSMITNLDHEQWCWSVCSTSVQYKQHVCDERLQNHQRETRVYFDSYQYGFLSSQRQAYRTPFDRCHQSTNQMEESSIGWRFWRLLKCSKVHFAILLFAFPSKAAYVLRAKEIHVGYTNGLGDYTEEIMDGHGARVFLHEYDHLQGICMDQQVKDGVYTNKASSMDLAINLRQTVHEIL